MSDLRRAVARLLAAFRPARAEADLTREIDAHLALLEDDFRRQGLTADRARLAARRALGGVALAKELHRDARSFPWIDDLRRDLLYAGRTLRRTPGFAIVAILTIALGVGANTAIFSVVHAVVLNPLPFADADRLVRLFENVPAAESRDGRPRRVGGMDVRELIELKARSRALSHVAGQGIALVSITGGVDVVQREVTSMSADAFPMLGIQPLLGRWFTREDERAGREKVIVLSHGAWQRYFAGDREALGRTIAFNGNTFSQGIALGEQYMVVGVMPPDFHFPDDNTEFWVPLVLAPPPDGRARRSTMTARLADGASPEAAAAEVEGIVRAVRGVAALPADGSQPRFEFVRVRDQFAASVRPALLVLMVAVAFVLLIACANIANLLLARAAYRQREMAVRAAIGAGRGRLVRQLLTESVVIALTGGGAGVVLAVGGVALFRHVATDLARIDLGSLDTAFPRLDAISINGPVLLFAVAISLATGLVFGLLPAIRSAQGGHAEALRGAGGAAFHAGAHGRSKTHDVLVMTEIALAMILLVGGALLIHSFVKLTKVELGYDPSNVLTFQASLPGIQRPPAELKAFAEDLVASLQKLPDVEAAGYANQLPLVALENSLALSTTPFPSAPQAAPPVDSPDARLVSRDFLETLGIRILAGRGFDEGDRAGQPRVLLVNQTLARREFGDRNPVGSTVYVWRDPMPWQVIGVVDDVRQAGLDREPRPQLFIDLRQWTAPTVPIFPAGAYYAVRARANAATVIPRVRAVVNEVDARASLENVASMDQIISNRMTRPRMYAVLLGLFAGIAVILALAGIYGVMSYSVARRTREIGIRIALGAPRAAVVGMVLRHSALLTGAGVGAGLVAARWTSRYLEGLLYGVTPLDGPTFLAVSLAFVLVALVAAFVPARRAAIVDPSIALRSE